MEKLSVKDAKERLNVAETTIRRMIKRGDLPNIERVKGKIWIPLSDLDAYEQKLASEAAAKSAIPPSSGSDAPEVPQEPVTPEAEEKAPVILAPKPGDVEEAEIAPKPEEPPTLEAHPESEDATLPKEEAFVVPESPESQKSVSMPTPDPHSTIAQPIDQLDDGSEPDAPSEITAEAEPASEPVPYSPGAVQAQGEQQQSFKWIAVQAGILSTKWLEEIFHSIRTALEKYKKESFPESSQQEE